MILHLPQFHQGLYKDLFLQPYIQLSSDTHWKADALQFSLLFNVSSLFFTFKSHHFSPIHEQTCLKGSAQIYCSVSLTLYLKIYNFLWSESGWMNPLKVKKKNKIRENSRMNNWQHTIPHSSLTWASPRENHFVKNECSMFGKRCTVNIIFTITVIWSVHLENNSQVISLNFAWIRQFLRGSVKCQTSFSLTNFSNVAPWFQAVNHPALCQPSVSSAPSVSEIRWRRAGQAFESGH